MCGHEKLQCLWALTVVNNALTMRWESEGVNVLEPAVGSWSSGHKERPKKMRVENTFKGWGGNPRRVVVNTDATENESKGRAGASGRKHAHTSRLGHPSDVTIFHPLHLYVKPDKREERGEAVSRNRHVVLEPRRQQV